MSRGQRAALVLAAVVVVVIAFVIASPGGEDAEPERPAEVATETDVPTETDAPTKTQPEARPAPAPERIVLARGAVEGGPREITATRGETVRVVVSSDQPDELHLHGFDITRTAAPGKPALFRFKASIEGSFEMESHTAEDAGRDPLVARVTVAPK